MHHPKYYTKYENYVMRSFGDMNLGTRLDGHTDGCTHRRKKFSLDATFKESKWNFNFTHEKWPYLCRIGYINAHLCADCSHRACAHPWDGFTALDTEIIRCICIHSTNLLTSLFHSYIIWEGTFLAGCPVPSRMFLSLSATCKLPHWFWYTCWHGEHIIFGATFGVSIYNH